MRTASILPPTSAGPKSLSSVSGVEADSVELEGELLLPRIDTSVSTGMSLALRPVCADEGVPQPLNEIHTEHQEKEHTRKQRNVG